MQYRQTQKKLEILQIHAQTIFLIFLLRGSTHLPASAYRFYTKRGKKLESAILRYRTLALKETSADGKTYRLTNIQPESEEGDQLS
jgi:hypothetical protein